MFPPGKRGKRRSLRTPANFIALQVIKELGGLQCLYRSIERDHRDNRLQQIYKEPGVEPPIVSGPKHSRKLMMQIIALPPPSTDTVDRWFEAGWNLILEETHGHPEWDARFRPLGKFREEYKKPSSPAARTPDTNVRDGIKQRLRTAFSMLMAERT